ncbi:UPF0182 family protein [bacterium]|jgi:uncharacterized protein|nr:UPF0182 family protein [bacterium]
MKRSKTLVLMTLFPVLILFGIPFTRFILNLYPELLWFRSFNAEPVWWFTLHAQLRVFGVALAVFSTFIGLNVWIARRISASTKSKLSTPHFNPPFEFMNDLYRSFQSYKSTSSFAALSSKAYRTLLILGVLGLASFFALITKSWWQEWYLYIHQTPFNIIEPIFNRDMGFYVFTLPLFQKLQNLISTLIIFTLGFVGWVYFSQNILAYVFSSQRSSGIKIHIAFILAILCFNSSADSFLNMAELLYSTDGSVFGAGYTDIHVRLFSQRIQAFLLLFEGVILLIWAFRSSLRIPALGFGLIIISSLFVGNVIPSIVQNFIVSPNEIQKELPYIKHNINYTRIAYGLDKVKVSELDLQNTLSDKTLQDNRVTLNNIRLWNREPLKQTFKQLQEIRLYYEFGQVDVDRYMIDGTLRQVMLSAREMVIDQLSPQAQTWLNRHLVYTHGYGLCLSPVNQVSPEGLPVFFIKDLPPVSHVGLPITRPEIYFGEKPNNYIIANTSLKEFDYPKGSKNQLTHYQGSGGIQLSSIFHRLIYAIKFSDIKILISNYIRPESRLLYDRNIATIVKKITPYIAYDNDPYLVLSDSGRMVWMMDGYTHSNKFPYSEPYRNTLNYIRNSVSVTIDAYDGMPHFYIKDPKDPIILTLAKLYPTLFKPFAEMPIDLQRHIRYPKDLFSIQADLYRTYHMTDPQVFYNREDLWDIPSETYGETEVKMEPYHAIVKLPGETKESFILMRPFTPTNKNNMIAWMSAKGDLENYGQLNVVQFSKKRTIFGPMQIESRIDQDTDISQNLTLWGQVGSRVIRGNLMVIPFENSLVYAEPIYLQATQSKMPELKRVILAYGDKIVMEKSLETAIDAIVGNTSPMKPIVDKKLLKSQSPTSKSILNELLQIRKTIDSLIKTVKNKPTK